jgi:hypothetical protein
MSYLFHLPQAVRVDSTGTPYAAAKANFYLTGTTTRTDTYSDSALTTPHANPVIADSAGQFAPIYLDPNITYRCVLTESDDTQIDDVDPVSAPITAASISVADSGGYFADATVEAVLADIGANYPKNASTETISANWTFSANLLMADNVIERPEIKDFSLTHNAVTSSSNAVTMDCSTGNSFYHLLTENTTVTLSNPSPTGKLCQIVIRIQQDGAGGAYTVTWPGSVTWAGGTAPTVSTGNDAVDKFTLTTDDAGTSWYGEFGQAYGAA